MVLTTEMKDRLLSDIKTDLQNSFLYGAIGTDNTAATEADTALGTEVFRDSTDDYDLSASDKFVASLRVLTTEANGNDIVEAGFDVDASASGNLLTRNVINSITKNNSKQLYFDVEITITVEEV